MKFFCFLFLIFGMSDLNFCLLNHIEIILKSFFFSRFKACFFSQLAFGLDNDDPSSDEELEKIKLCRDKCKYYVNGPPVIDPYYSPRHPQACFTICCRKSRLPCWPKKVDKKPKRKNHHYYKEETI